MDIFTLIWSNYFEFDRFFICLLRNLLAFFSPINQISFGIGNLLSNSNSGLYKPAPVISYSSMAKKEPLQPVKTINNVPRPVLTKTLNKTSLDNKKTGKATETALSAGYRFKARNPEPDPRYPADQQLMVGPIPGGKSRVSQS